MKKSGILAALVLSLLAVSPLSANASAPSLHLYPNRFRGLGDIALIYNNDGIHGGALYTIINADGPHTHAVKSYFLQHGVISASFSPNGKWLTVMTINQNQYVLWLISANGKKKQEIGSQVYAYSFAPQSDVLYYSTYQGTVYSLIPMNRPHQLKIAIGANTLVTGFSFFNNQMAAVTLTKNANNYTDQYDEIALLHIGRLSLQPVFKTSPPNGLVIGPWLNSSQFFFWKDPAHSGSIRADGLPLFLYTIRKGDQPVSHTYASPYSVIPLSKTKALIWEIYSRYYYLSHQSLTLWPGAPISLPTRTLALFPTVDAAHSEIAFALGRPLQITAVNSQIRTWTQSLLLATWNLSTKQLQIYQNAGKGVTNPYFNTSGDRIIYALNSSVNWIDTLGDKGKSTIATVLLPTMPNQIQIADYLPTPITK